MEGLHPTLIVVFIPTGILRKFRVWMSESRRGCHGNNCYRLVFSVKLLQSQHLLRGWIRCEVR